MSLYESQTNVCHVTVAVGTSTIVLVFIVDRRVFVIPVVKQPVVIEESVFLVTHCLGSYNVLPRFIYALFGMQRSPSSL